MQSQGLVVTPLERTDLPVGWTSRVFSGYANISNTETIILGNSFLIKSGGAVVFDHNEAKASFFKISAPEGNSPYLLYTNGPVVMFLKGTADITTYDPQENPNYSQLFGEENGLQLVFRDLQFGINRFSSQAGKIRVCGAYTSGGVMQLLPLPALVIDPELVVFYGNTRSNTPNAGAPTVAYTANMVACIQALPNTTFAPSSPFGHELAFTAAATTRGDLYIGCGTVLADNMLNPTIGLLVRGVTLSSGDSAVRMVMAGSFLNAGFLPGPLYVGIIPDSKTPATAVTAIYFARTTGLVTSVSTPASESRRVMLF